MNGIDEILFSDDYIVLYCNDSLIVEELNKSASEINFLNSSVGKNIIDYCGVVFSKEEEEKYKQRIKNHEQMSIQNILLPQDTVDLVLIPVLSKNEPQKIGYNCIVYSRSSTNGMTIEQSNKLIMKNYFDLNRRDVISIIHILLPFAARLEEMEMSDENRKSLLDISSKCYDIMRSNMQTYEYYSLVNNTSEDKFEEVCINHFLQDYYDAMRQLVGHAGYEINLQCPNQMIYSVVDKDKLILALTNIISNSCLYSFPNSKITILLKKAKNTFSISVKDDGVGMTKEVMKNALELFYSHDPNGIEKRSGMGLAVVKKIVEKHKGTIMITSKEDDGTTISINLPITDGESSPTKRIEFRESRRVPLINNGFSPIAIAFSEVFHFKFI